MIVVPEQSIYKCELHNIVQFRYISEWSVYLYRLTTRVASWTEDIELRDINHLLIIMYCKAVMTMYFSQWCKLCQGIKSQGIAYFGVYLDSWGISK